MIESLATLIAAYFVGSLSFAVIVSRAFRLPDPRSYGSHNPGATNVMRSGHKLVAGLTLVGDALKGVAAVLLARWAAGRYGLPPSLPPLAGLAAFGGHLYPVFFGFKGGKGVATALGILVALNPWLGLACAASWLAVFALSRISSLSALAAALLAPIYASLLKADGATTGAIALLAVLVFWRHRSNIARLMSGQEGKP
jgi:acyl phosphate:glycerol-3-phosphate acyltransferase